MSSLTDEILRMIANNRNFKTILVVRNLINNPKTPIDVSLHMLPILNAIDLKRRIHQQERSETLRTTAAAAAYPHESEISRRSPHAEAPACSLTMHPLILGIQSGALRRIFLMSQREWCAQNRNCVFSALMTVGVLSVSFLPAA
jgi:hypothetical protein